MAPAIGRLKISCCFNIFFELINAIANNYSDHLKMYAVLCMISHSEHSVQNKQPIRLQYKRTKLNPIVIIYLYRELLNTEQILTSLYSNFRNFPVLQSAIAHSAFGKSSKKINCFRGTIIFTIVKT